MARQQQVDRIANLLRGQCNVALHAAPGVGKTWLSDQIIGALGGESGDLLRVDLSVHSNAAGVLAAINERIGGVATPEVTGVHDAWRALRDNLVKRSVSCVVILDEFDEVLQYEDALEFLKLLRELVHRPATTRCAVLILSRRSLETIESQIRGISTLATICYPEYLGGVTSSDIETVWPSANGISRDAIDECISWTAGYAPLVRYWLALYPSVPNGSQGEHQQVLEFERLLDHLYLTELLNAAAQLVIGPIVDIGLREARQLESLGVLGPLPDGGYGSHDVFVACLRRRTINLDPWGPLGLAELRMRSVIDEVLTSGYGPDWPQELSKSNRAVAAAVTAARPKQDVDQRRFGNSMDWLAYTYPQDLGNIVISNWSHFQDVFRSGSRDQWRERFETLAQYRTPVAHNRAGVLSDTQRQQCRVYADEVLRAIDDYLQR